VRTSPSEGSGESEYVAIGSSFIFTECFSVSFPFPLSFLGLPLPLDTTGGGSGGGKGSSRAGAEVAREIESSSKSWCIGKGSESGSGGILGWREDASGTMRSDEGIALLFKLRADAR
jgi:hypothetical protein